MNSSPHSSWLLDAVGDAQVTPQSSHVATNEEQQNSGLSKIGEGVRYTKTLILYFHAALIAIILAVMIQHWAGELVSWTVKKQRFRNHKALLVNALQHDQLEASERALIKPSLEEIASSGSSTLSASTRSSQDTKTRPDERTSLLRRQEPATSTQSSLRCRIRSLLMYQPPPIPIVNKILPDNGTTLAVLGLLGINIFFLLYRCPLELASVLIIADRAGMLFVASLPYLYIFAAKNQPLQLLTGRSYETLNIYHRRLGEWLCFLALIHTTGMVYVWYSFLRPVGWTLAYFLGRQIIILGLVALVCYELLHFTSLGCVRQRIYEFFLASHIILQAAALGLIWFHHFHSRVYVGAALAIFLLDRLFFRIVYKSRSFRATFEVMDFRHRWLRLRVTIPVSAKGYLSGDFKHGWKPTQHAFVSVASLPGTHAFQAHPFTIASAAPLSHQAHDTCLDLVIAAHDGFTNDIFKYADSHSTGTVRLDGPYGSTHAVDMMAAKDNAVVVAAGTGIAVAIPLLHELVRQRRQRFDLEGSDPHKQSSIVLILVVRSSALLQSLYAQYLDELERKGVTMVLSAPTEEAGRPDVTERLDDATTSNIEAARRVSTQSIGVVCSAPDGLNRTVRNWCALQAWHGRDVDVAVEKFGW